MWEDKASTYRELYVDDNVYVWQRGPKAVFVVKSGLGYQSSIPINSSAILQGTQACLMERDGKPVRSVGVIMWCLGWHMQGNRHLVDHHHHFTVLHHRPNNVHTMG